VNTGNMLGASLRKKTEAEAMAQKVMKNPELLSELLSGISSTNPKTKFTSAKILRIISDENPEMLYSEMDFFEDLLNSENSILKWNAMDIIANLATVDSKNRFNGLCERYLSLLREESLITAGHVVDNSAKIALSKPELTDKITEELLKVERLVLPTAECRNILIGHTIEALGAYYYKIKDKNKVVSFVRRQMNNPRNATKAKAKLFLREVGRGEQE